MSELRILVVRLGAMGDIIHTLPAAAALRRSLVGSHLTWLVEQKWTTLLEGNPYVDQVEILERGSAGGILRSASRLRQRRYDIAVDFQGLIKSAMAAIVAGPEKLYGFHRSQIKEKPAAWFYSRTVATHAAHVIGMNLELAAAAGATTQAEIFPLPQGEPEGTLPEGRFVLANPLAGWGSKQWPLEHYTTLARLLRTEAGLTLVVNGPPAAESELREIEGVHVHISSLKGLIHATRRAEAVVGLDSGPLHLAAALGIPGVAIFGPTDPARNGPCGGSITVLRASEAARSYKHSREIDPSMRTIGPEAVFAALAPRLAARK